jgi:carboxylesterase type B
MLLTSIIVRAGAAPSEAIIASGDGKPKVVVNFNGTEVIFEGAPVQGKYSNVEAFYGVKYAAEPKLWQPPVFVSYNQTQTIDASNPSFRACLQAGSSRSTTGSNDCLKMSIWKPRGHPCLKTKSCPVMVFIHGGSYKTGGVSQKVPDGPGIFGLGTGIFGGENLVDGTVVVAIQYRLGVFGFAGSDQLKYESQEPSVLGEISGTTGNWGILDQRLALEWVHDHIDAFGGDGKQLFAFGQSAGAYCVSLHLASPLEFASPLIKAAGFESAPFPLMELPIIRTTLQEAQTQYDSLAEALKCKNTDRKAERECFEKSFAEDPNVIFQASVSIQLFHSPVIDMVVFLAGFGEALDSGKVVDIPMIMGSNANEGTTGAPLGPGQSLGGWGNNRGIGVTRVDLDEMTCYGTGGKMNELLPLFNSTKVPKTTPPLPVNENVTKYYWDNANIATAVQFTCNVVNAAQMLASPSRHPVYVYEFRANTGLISRPDQGLMKDGSPIKESAGVSHGWELPSVFASSRQFADFIRKDKSEPPSYYLTGPLGDEHWEKQVEALDTAMSSTWIHFAKTHNVDNMNWKRWDNQKPSRAIFDYDIYKNNGYVVNDGAGQAVGQCDFLLQVNAELNEEGVKAPGFGLCGDVFPQRTL